MTTLSNTITIDGTTYNKAKGFVCADLRGVNLSGMNLSGMNFTGANLTGADFTDADLRGVIGIKSKN